MAMTLSDRYGIVTDTLEIDQLWLMLQPPISALSSMDKPSLAMPAMKSGD